MFKPGKKKKQKPGRVAIPLILGTERKANSGDNRDEDPAYKA